MSNIAQRNFAGGELAPALYSRTDQQKYQTGLRTCRNFVVRRTGGVENRAGSQFIHEAKDSANALRLIPFIFINGSTDNTYLLEFGNQCLRFVQNAGAVVTSGVSAWVTATVYAVADLVTQSGVTYYCLSAHTSGATTQPGTGTSWQTNWYALTDGIYEIPTPYVASDLAALDFVQNKDVVTLVHPSYPVQELKRLGHTQWTLAPMVFGPGIATPTSVAATGGIAGVDTYYAVTALDAITNEESLPGTYKLASFVPDASTPVVITWALVSGADSYNVYRSTDGVSFGFIGRTGGTPSAASDTSWTSATATISTSTRDAWVASGGQARNPVVAVATDKATDGKYTVYATVSVTATNLGSVPDTTAGRIRAYYSRDGETRVDAGLLFTTSNLQGEGTLGPLVFSGVVTVPDNGYAALTIDLVPEVFGTSADGSILSFACDIDAGGAPNNRIDWNKGGSSFSDANAAAPNMAEGPPAQPALFASAGDYPSAVGYYQQRQLFGNTTNDPERVWASRSASFRSFATSTPLQDDDAVSFRLADQHLNAIRHFVDLYSKLVVFATEAEFTIEGDQAGTLLPSAINPRRQSAAGSGNLPPLTVVKTILFAQGRGSVIRDLRRAVTDYDNSDLTLFASHLFDGYTLTDWAYAKVPHSVVYVIRDDGALNALTYVPDQDIWGWSRHDTDGEYENVCVVPEGNEDSVYVVVRRTINGTAKRYVERFASRTITARTDVRELAFADAYLVYDGRNTGAETVTVSGGTTWDENDTLTVTRSVGGFVADDANTTAIQLTAADGTQRRITLTGYTSGTVMTGVPNRLLPVDLRSTATTSWALAAQVMSGLDHLEAKAVSVYADAYVESSPNNPNYPSLTVSGGTVTLSQPRAVVYIGLPYIADLETLDIDSASGASLKESYRNVSRVGVFLQDTRGVFAGPSPSAGLHGPTDDAPTQGLQELKLRDRESYDDPTALITNSKQISVDANWNDHGRVFLRQVDPLPVTVLSITPMGKL